MENNDGFIPIIAIFYAVFHPTEGTKIVHQVPEGSIISNNSPITSTSLFNFDTVKNYIIPKPQLCNKLISFKIDKYRVLGYPVNIENEDYSRNSFNFNFGFVFPYDSETSPYEPAIKRMGKMFRVLEEQSFLLSKLDKNYSFYPKNESHQSKIPLLISHEFNNGSGSTSLMTNNFDGRLAITPGHSRIKRVTLSSIESLIDQIYQDLNNYSECCIPLDSANSVDIKLFPILSPPMNIKAYQVPLLTVKLTSLIDVNWDPTMIKILPFINGINSVRKISELANSDYLLTKQCIQHLMHYKCISIIDVFQFSNIYAPTNNIGNFLKMNSMAEECQSYIISGEEGRASTNKGNNEVTDLVSPYTRINYLNDSSNKASAHLSMKNNKKNIKVPSKATLFYLYRSLNQGQTIKEWYIQHRKQLGDIDIRRFITFGVLRGIIYRIHSYPIINSFTKSAEKQIDDELQELIELINDNDSKPDKIKSKTTRKVSFNYNLDNRNQILKETIGGDNISTFDSDDDDDDYSDEISTIRHPKARTESMATQDSEDYSHHQDIDVDSSSEDEQEQKNEMIKLIKLLKGYQNTDSISTELHKSRGEVEGMLGKLGNYSIINS